MSDLDLSLTCQADQCLGLPSGYISYPHYVDNHGLIPAERFDLCDEHLNFSIEVTETIIEVADYGLAGYFD